MINFDDVTKENIKEHNPNWSKILDHSQRILIIGGSGWEKTNSLFNLIKEESDFDKIYLYAKDQYEAKHQSLINKGESTDLQNVSDLKPLLNTQMTWMIFVKSLKNTTQIRNVKY